MNFGALVQKDCKTTSPQKGPQLWTLCEKLDHEWWMKWFIKIGSQICYSSTRERDTKHEPILKRFTNKKKVQVRYQFCEPIKKQVHNSLSHLEKAHVQEKWFMRTGRFDIKCLCMCVSQQVPVIQKGDKESILCVGSFECRLHERNNESSWKKQWEFKNLQMKRQRRVLGHLARAILTLRACESRNRPWTSAHKSNPARGMIQANVSTLQCWEVSAKKSTKNLKRMTCYEWLQCPQDDQI